MNIRSLGMIMMSIIVGRILSNLINAEKKDGGLWLIKSIHEKSYEHANGQLQC
jgi:hypothetical protein